MVEAGGDTHTHRQVSTQGERETKEMEETTGAGKFGVWSP